MTFNGLWGHLMKNFQLHNVSIHGNLCTRKNLAKILKSGSHICTYLVLEKKSLNINIKDIILLLYLLDLLGLEDNL